MIVSKIAAFYSVNEANKPAGNRVHHDNNTCRPGQDIPPDERRSGTGGYRLCEICDDLDRKGR
jgi:hypothetical protein